MYEVFVVVVVVVVVVSFLSSFFFEDSNNGGLRTLRIKISLFQAPRWWWKVVQ